MAAPGKVHVLVKGEPVQRKWICPGENAVACMKNETGALSCGLAIDAHPLHHPIIVTFFPGSDIRGQQTGPARAGWLDCAF